MGTLWNTYAFFVLYANIDDFDATKYTLDYDKLSVMDKWLLSKLNSAIKAVDYDLSNYKIPEAAKALQSFVDDMSNWYVRRSRERFWAKGMEQDKINAYMTLYTALVEICKTAAPMIPFMTEEIYQNLVRSVDESAPESIHLCDFPVVNEAHIDTELEANMDNVLKLVVMGRACRNTANIKNRQPIGQMYVKADFEVPEFYKDIVKDELNVKNVTFTQDVRDFTSYTFKPQLKTVGPKYGKMLGGIKAALDNLEGNAAMDELNATDALKLDINGQEVTLFREDLLIDLHRCRDMYLRMTTELQLLWIQTFPKNFWKKDLYVRSSVKYRPCVRKPDSKLWIRSQYLMKVQKKQRKYLQTMHLRSQMKHLHWKLQKQHQQATRKSGRSMEKL